MGRRMLGRLSRIVLACLFAVLGYGQETQPPPLPSIRTTTRLVVVDAIVTDTKSQPVGDLKSSDFRVLEDGKPQKISFFTFETAAPETTTAPAPQTLGPGTFTNNPEFNAPHGPLVILLMDGLNTPPSQEIYVRQQIVKYLSDLKTSSAGTAVLALGNSLNVVQNFTTSQELLLAAALKYRANRTAADVESPPADLMDSTKGIGAPAGAGPYVNNDPANQLVPNRDDEGSLAGAQALRQRFEKEVAASEQDVRVRGTLAALRSISRAVSGYPGRKALLWFSAGFPFSLDLNAREDFLIYKSYKDELRQASAMLSDANVAIYPIDGRALFTNSLSDSSTASQNVGLNSNGPSADQSAEVSKKFQVEASMDALAHDTGGLVFRNTNDISGALQAAIKDSQSYYVLGYYPERKNWDGKFHAIKIEVANKDVKVRARAGYFAVDPAEWKKGSGEDEKHIIPSELHVLAATGIVLDSRVLPPEQKGKPAVVEILVDTNSISFGQGTASAQPEEGSSRGLGGGGQSDAAPGGPETVHTTDLDFEAAAFTPEGKLVHLESRSARADLREDTYQRLVKAGKFGLKMELPLPAGQYLVRVAVRDNHTGRIGSVDMPLKIEQ
jgi:VWFA-related protein